PRRVVGAAAARLPRLFRLYRLFHLGGASRESLLVQRQRRGLSVAFLFAGDFRHYAARDFRNGAGLVAVVAAQIFTGLPDFVGASRFPVHLLLLSRRVLQGVLGRSHQLRRRRTAKRLS